MIIHSWYAVIVLLRAFGTLATAQAVAHPTLRLTPCMGLLR